MPQRGRAGSAPQVSNPLRFRTDVFLLSDVHLYSSARKTQTARILTHRKGSLKHRHFLLVAFRIFAPAARGLRKCGAVRLRPSTVPVLCPAKPGLVLRVWPACLRKTAKRRVCDASRAAYARIGQPTHQSAQRGRSGARKSSRCTVRQEPASHHGTNGLILRTVRRSTAVGNAVPSALSTAVGRRPTGCTELARCAGPALPASTAPSSAQSSHGSAGPELTQTVACAGAGVLDDFPRSSARAPGQARAAFSPCSLVCRSASRRVLRTS